MYCGANYICLKECHLGFRYEAIIFALYFFSLCSWQYERWYTFWLWFLSNTYLMKIFSVKASDNGLWSQHPVLHWFMIINSWYQMIPWIFWYFYHHEWCLSFMLENKPLFATNNSHLKIFLHTGKTKLILLLSLLIEHNFWKLSTYYYK